MPIRRIPAAAPPFEVAAQADTSGLTTGYVRPDPIIFGSERHHRLLLEIAQLGEVRVKRKYKGYYKRLAEIGLCVLRYEPGRDVLTISPRHPAASEIRAVLTEMLGAPVVTAPVSVDAGVVHPTMPLGHVSPVDFRVLVVIADANERLDEQTIRRRIPDHWPSSVTSAMIVSRGVVYECPRRGLGLSP